MAQKDNATKKVDFRYTLSTFVSLPNVLPVFYDENINMSFSGRYPSVCREYFCMFFDLTDKHYKVLMYYTNNPAETAYGVKMSKLRDYMHTVHGSEDIEKLRLATASPFLRENLAILSNMFDGCSISEFMRNVVDILARLERVKPKIASPDTSNGHIDYTIKRENKSKADVEYYCVNFPIFRALRPAMDVFGKNRYKQSVEDTTVRVYNKLDFFSFDDVNFANTARLLHNQYKLKHKISDFLSRKIPKRFMNIPWYKMKTV